MVNAGTFDYAGDGWGYSYGAAAEWYQGRFAVRGGVFDLSATPAGGTSPDALNLDPTFSQFQVVGEIEERHQLWGQPGKIKVTGFLSHGRAALFSDAIALAQATGTPGRHRAGTQQFHQPRPASASIWSSRSPRQSASSRAPAGPTARSSLGISPTSTAPSPAVCRSTAKIGAGPTTRSASAASSMAFAGMHQAYFNAGGTRHPDRRRAIAASRGRGDR